MDTFLNRGCGAGSRLIVSLLALMAVAATTVKAQGVFIPSDFVTVGYLGNPADGNGLGSVNYEYHIGKYEVTNQQYAAFLNATAKSDPFALYNTNMATAGAFGGGITRLGTPGSYSYTVKAGYENKPVVYVSYWDAARFANWVGTGYTEGRATVNGPVLAGAAYDLNFSLTPSTLQGNRLAGATIALPKQNEWYKAAYYQPAGLGGPSDSYWLYPTKSDSIPTSATGPGNSRANFYFNDNIANGLNGGYAVTQSLSLNPNQVYLTDVGIYGLGSASFFGTFDQGGNVWEWNSELFPNIYRGLEGGAWSGSENYLRSSDGNGVGFLPEAESFDFGFRVANLAAIPEPSSYAAIAGLMSLGVAMWRRRVGRM